MVSTQTPLTYFLSRPVYRDLASSLILNSHSLTDNSVHPVNQLQDAVTIAMCQLRDLKVSATYPAFGKAKSSLGFEGFGVLVHVANILGSRRTLPSLWDLPTNDEQTFSEPSALWYKLRFVIHYRVIPISSLHCSIFDIFSNANADARARSIAEENKTMYLNDTQHVST